jgi:dihydropteroate synthase
MPDAGSRKPLVMGVANVTPDSFSGDGDPDPMAAIEHGLQLVADGADIVDVGGEATNPRAKPVAAEQEMARVIPVVSALAAAGVRVSIDTTKAVVALAACRAGATIINDVSGGLWDPEMAAAVDATGAIYIAGHLRGAAIADVFAREAQSLPTWREVAGELSSRLAALSPASRARAWVDPGLGFGKAGDPAANMALVHHAGDIATATGCPVVLGPSRKRFLSRIIDEHVTAPDAGRRTPDSVRLDVASVAACLAGVTSGAHVLRIHNASLLRIALAVYLTER